MLGTGCGSRPVPFSTSSSGFTLLWPLAKRRTKMETTSSRTCWRGWADAPQKHRRPRWPASLSTGSTSLCWRSFLLSTSTSRGKLLAASSRQQDALWVRTIHSLSWSMKKSTRRTSRGWSWPMPRGRRTPPCRPTKNKVWQRISGWICLYFSVYFGKNSSTFSIIFVFSSQAWNVRPHQSPTCCRAKARKSNDTNTITTVVHSATVVTTVNSTASPKMFVFYLNPYFFVLQGLSCSSYLPGQRSNKYTNCH